MPLEMQGERYMLMTVYSANYALLGSLESRYLRAFFATFLLKGFLFSTNQQLSYTVAAGSVDSCLHCLLGNPALLCVCAAMDRL